MAPAGLEFVWRDLKSAKSGDVVGRLVIASFKGDCAIDPAPQGRLDDAPLGWTDVSDEAVLPFISISCDRVQTLIHPLSRGMPLGHQEEVFGGALARVMAHELYHFLAGTIRHSSQGVAKPYFTANDLVSPDFNFEAKENTAMWRSRARASAATATASEAIAGRAK
jgi:hypothetical protein